MDSFTKRRILKSQKKGERVRELVGLQVLESNVCKFALYKSSYTYKNLQDEDKDEKNSFSL